MLNFTNKESFNINLLKLTLSCKRGLKNSQNLFALKLKKAIIIPQTIWKISIRTKDSLRANQP